MNRRTMISKVARTLAGCAVGSLATPSLLAGSVDSTWNRSVQLGLDWLARNQSPRGRWIAGTYPTAMTALAGTAMLAAGSTATQGPYSKHVRGAIDFLLTKSRPNGLIGDPITDQRYTYGHGFSMLFLSQILGEEEDEDRREELTGILQKSVEFSGNAQTTSGGWGYVSARDGNDFDEGSTTITQVQGLRGCRNAGIPVPTEIIERAKHYIYKCKNPDGGISYSSHNLGSSRPAITAAALACLYNAGDYDSKHVPEMLDYCRKNLHRIDDGNAFGHWHYTYLYYSQVIYREGGEEWSAFRDRLYTRIVREQQRDGSWHGQVGPVYITSLNLIMLLLDRGLLPVYQR